ncbi:hypothetical protein AMJ80_11665 [bacterium SM23_31]|nr:MAG: hypothetical protein AMJ80_11665 [bacterium SM23_31]
MTFNKIREDVNVDCIKEFKPKENTEDIFTRALKSNKITDDDLKSLWELGRKGYNSKKEICQRKGLSVDKLSNINIDEIEKKYKRIKQFKTKSRRCYFYCKFRFMKNAGKVWDSLVIRDSHKTFFKSDSFTKENLIVLEIRLL